MRLCFGKSRARIFFVKDMSKAALITGGTSGIGFAVAEILTKSGWRVAVMGRNRQRGEMAVAALGDGALFVEGDVTRQSDCLRVVEECAKHFGALDALINSAGEYAEKSLDDTSEELFDRIMAVNMKGVFLMCKAAVPLLKNSGGAIVNVSSDAGVHGNYCCAAYCSAKGAVNLFTKALALELAAFNVRVNAVAWGDILTPLTERQLAESPEGREKALALMESVYPLHRIGTPTEAANVIVFLATAASSFVTGAVWSADGGLTA